ncbi:MAG: tetratricopeptide repeat protein [Bacteroidales bacterium]|nr:tetratricopeptide repeat protein [Bacteroidales bacterium]MCF8455783.1 tetratricopeptide repeat protein [Bacteroidales bacterium]
MHHSLLLVVISVMICLSPTRLFANEPDSLKALLTVPGHSSQQKFDIHSKISKFYIDEDLDSARSYIQKAIELAKELDDDKKLADAWQSKGDVELFGNNLDSAQKCFFNCIAIFQGKSFENDFAKTYNRMGNISFSQGKYSDALKYFQSGLKIAERTGDSLKIAIFYSNLGVIHSNLLDEEKALEYLLNSLKIHESLNNYCSEITLLSTISLIYLDNGDNENAQRYLMKGIDQIEKCDRLTIKIQFYVDLGRFEITLKNYRKAIEYLLHSLDLATATKNKEIVPESTYLSYIYQELGDSYLQLNEFEKAKNFFKKGLSFTNKDLNPEAFSGIMDGLAMIYEKFGQTDSALLYYKIYKATSDSLLNEQNVREIAQLELKYEYEKDIEERNYLEEIQKKKTIVFQVTTFAISSLLIILFLIFLLFYRSKKNQLKQSALVQRNLQIDLNYKNKELITKAIYFHHKEDFMLRLIQKLETIKSNAKIENVKELEKILKELEHDVSNKEWKEFELRFNEVHDDFYTKLKDKYPELTQNDLKLCALLKLGMSTKDIAAITFQSLNSINVARYRLRKKLKLDTEINLNSFFSNF